jgi:hypothetical protein
VETLSISEIRSIARSFMVRSPFAAQPICCGRPDLTAFGSCPVTSPWWPSVRAVRYAQPRPRLDPPGPNSSDRVKRPVRGPSHHTRSDRAMLRSCKYL